MQAEDLSRLLNCECSVMDLFYVSWQGGSGFSVRCFLV